jgi:acyl-CoA reductase-like NAD-dependent aldehyde dehydrogenase
LYSEDIAAAHAVADDGRSDMVWINNPTGTSPEHSFGGA